METCDLVYWRPCIECGEWLGLNPWTLRCKVCELCAEDESEVEDA